METANLQTLLSGKSKIGVEVFIDKESAIILALTVIASIVVGGLLLRMLIDILNLK